MVCQMRRIMSSQMSTALDDMNAALCSLLLAQTYALPAIPFAGNEWTSCHISMVRLVLPDMTMTYALHCDIPNEWTSCHISMDRLVLPDMTMTYALHCDIPSLVTSMSPVDWTSSRPTVYSLGGKLWEEEGLLASRFSHSEKRSTTSLGVCWSRRLALLEQI